MNKLEKHVPKKEASTYYIGALGQGMVYGIMSSYISDFYLSVLQLRPTFVLFLMLFARFGDAVYDPIIGAVIDRSRPKRGKMLPYLLYTPLPIAILTFMLFFAPDLSIMNKMIYAGITYVLWGMIYSISDVPFWSLPNAMTTSPDERGKLISVARTTNGIGSAIPMAIFMALGFILPQLGLSGLQLEKVKYITIAVIASVIGNILFSRVAFKVKERVDLPVPQKREKGEPGALKLVFTCKPLMLTVAMGILSAGRYMYQAGAIHVARYSFYIGEPLEGLDSAARELALQSSISSVNTIFAIATAIGMFGTMLMIPKLIEKYSYKSLIIGSCIIGVTASLGMFAVGYSNFWVCVPLLVISCIPLGVINVVSFAMIGDALDYMEWKTGIRQTGLGSACQSFVLQLGNALATSSIVLIYIIVKLDISTIGNSSFTPDMTLLEPTIRTGMFSLVSLIPAISLLLCMIPIFFYDLTGEKKDKITRELAEQRKELGVR